METGCSVAGVWCPAGLQSQMKWRRLFRILEGGYTIIHDGWTEQVQMI